MKRVSTAEVVKAGMSAAARDVHTGCPGIVQKFDPKTRTADVQPVPFEILYDGKGARVETAYPVIPNVKVATLRGKGYVIAFPVAVGDSVWLQFSEASWAEWRTTGNLSPQLDTQRHPLSYPVAIPEVQPDTTPMESADAAANALVIGRDAGNVQIQITESEIKLGKGASDAVAKAPAVMDALTALSTFLTACGAAVVETGIATAANTAKAAVDEAKAHVAAQLTKVQ